MGIDSSVTTFCLFDFDQIFDQISSWRDEKWQPQFKFPFNFPYLLHIFSPSSFSKWNELTNYNFPGSLSKKILVQCC
jgi:hypothetical protein